MNRPIKTKKALYANRKRGQIMKQVAAKAKIRVQLDSKTVISIPDMEALKLWLVRYPQAKVISTESAPLV